MDSIGILRPILDTELELMRSWRNAPSVRSKMYTRHEISAEEHLNWWNRTSKRDDCKYLMYEFSSVPTGIVGFSAIDRVNENASWAHYASPEAPKGTGPRIEFLGFDYAFSELALHKLHCEILAFNTPVIKLHQKFGFQIEGILRQQHKFDDAFIDVYRLGLLAEEWKAKREEMIKRVLAAARR